MESEKVHWYVGSQVVVEPAAQLPSFIEVIADLGDDQVCDLDVRLSPVLDLLYRLENWLRVRYSDVFSDKVRLCASFEINCYAVEKVVHHRDGVWSVESVGDEDVDEPVLPCLNPDVTGELHKDRRLVVSVSNALTTMAQRQADNVGRHEVCSFHFSPLADVKVLAVGAEPVTTSRSDREYFGSGHVVN